MTDRFSFAEPGAQTALPVKAEAGPACATDSCITCGDIAVQVVVLRLLPDSMAVVAVTTADGSPGEEEVSVALVDAGLGDTILVHAGEAIALIK